MAVPNSSTPDNMGPLDATFSETALAKSVPKGLSMTMRERSTRPASPSRRTADKAALEAR